MMKGSGAERMFGPPVEEEAVSQYSLNVQITNPARTRPPTWIAL